MGFTHLDDKGRISMVDVAGKEATARVAVARGSITMSRDAFNAVTSDQVAKGNVLATAKIAAIMAAKTTANTIPLCHPLPIDQVIVEFFPHEESSSIEVESTVKVSGKTGVEMEALHAASIALLTIYDMCKAIDKTMVISDIRLMEKSGGKSGRFKRP
ncbi:MAG: Cyclic pyranopterin monophosphate synthase accessory protein [Deltaproteobacteria bacterium ADurb.BinA179]|jgi:cyclic pyranopterin phosphate synthase|nr:MAG: Cyclic pyranopterin monophosphate synthase accessory protein [Deltaproteobacteria bacterium ADurb.BinA179]HNR52100.1 cyclic pyranopterin monophosphate synthase MoaC [Deltaproteobacteria bacterium]HRR21054.1 cyclic pyranopterin monophosphate synthase MoaC [Desulfomonilia bacterium]HNU74377.1 cyclic pyranopterin monophosphate synthase MoaC [Deltaproteobacteria bacterium]HOD69727.1 cyclic pyranopterin monophosphate synthase MoaC [Deltaproteobacteria bacterium]